MARKLLSGSDSFFKDFFKKQLRICQCYELELKLHIFCSKQLETFCISNNWTNRFLDSDMTSSSKQL